MMRLAMKWVNASYVPKIKITMPQTAFETLRPNFNMFGLGQKTGIDLPGEISGIQGRSFNDQGLVLSGSVLDLSYGNYDAYTLIQMAQYVSTIANGGYRMQPYVVQSVGRTANKLKKVKPSISGKSGTAQTFYYDPDNPNQKNPPELVNATFVGYAPSNNPEIATAVIFPGLDPKLEGSYTLQMTKAMVQDYFKLHKK